MSERDAEADLALCEQSRQGRGLLYCYLCKKTFTDRGQDKRGCDECPSSGVMQAFMHKAAAVMTSHWINEAVRLRAENDTLRATMRTIIRETEDKKLTPVEALGNIESRARQALDPKPTSGNPTE